MAAGAEEKFHTVDLEKGLLLPQAGALLDLRAFACTGAGPAAVPLPAVGRRACLPARPGQGNLVG
jgi:hypothetical protein